MTKSLSLALALLGATLLPLQATADVPAANTTIDANGTGTVTALPDLAYVDFAIDTSAHDATTATSRNNAIYDHFTAGMRAIGIKTADIQTDAYTLNYTPQPPKSAPPMTWGYTVERTVTVTVRALNDVGKTIDTAVAGGVNNVRDVSFGLSDTKALMERALAQAVADARREAQVVASAAGLRIVGIQRISPSYNAPPRPMAYVRAAAAADSYAVPTQISPPSGLDVRATVTITYVAQP